MRRNVTPSRGFPCLVAYSLVLAAVVFPGKAEEITLENGKKVTGAIVGFENGMFKVETEFGFALVRKDKVKSISFAPGDVSRADQPKESAPVTTPQPVPEKPAPKPASTATVEVKPAPPPPPPPPVSRPIDQPLPDNIQARVEGNAYFNDTFAFTFYKPPGWKVHEDAARETGRAVAAVGSEDEHTILFVDRQVWSGEPNLKSDETEARLRATYQNYRKTSEAAATISGRPAVRREFEGELDGALWRGVAVRVAKDHTVFGVIGLTSAETLEFHAAILNKIINSFEFLPPKGPAAANR